MVKVFSVLKEEKGAVLVLLAISFMVLLGCAALVTDYGVVALERRKMVTAADAGALAGARVLLESGASAKDVAKQVAFDYAFNNGANADMISVDVTDNYSFNGNQIQAVVVDAGQTKDFFFAKIFGLENTDVYGQAVGAWSYVGSSNNYFPLYIDYNDFVGIDTSAPLHLKNVDAEANWGFFLPNNDPYGNTAKANVRGDEDAPAFSLIKVSEDPFTVADDDYKYNTTTGKKVSMQNEVETRLERNYYNGLSLYVMVPVLEEDPGFDKSGPIDVVVRGFIVYEIQDVIMDNHGNGSKYATNLENGKVRSQHSNYYEEYHGQVHRSTIIGMVRSDILSDPLFNPTSTHNILQDGFGVKYSFLIN